MRQIDEEALRELLTRGNQRTPGEMLTMISAERMRLDFRLFVRRCWHLIEPKYLAWNWHLDAMSDHLVWVTQEEIRFLMIMIPPRMTKSLISTVIWPAWHWIVKPQTQFIGASYSADLALEHAGLSRRLIQSSWYQSHFGGDWFLRADENRRDMFRNSAGGYRLTTSVSGRTTGEGGDIQCFPASTLVTTDRGRLPIAALENFHGRVLSWNGTRTRWSRVIGFHRSTTKTLVRITSAAGVLRCTEDHPVYVAGRGWIEAGSIKRGDAIYAESKSALQSLPQNVLSATRARRSIEDGDILQPDMLRSHGARREKPAMCRWNPAGVPRLWSDDPGETIGYAPRPATHLLYPVSLGVEEKPSQVAVLRCLSNSLLSMESRQPVLLSRLRQQGTRNADTWGGQWSVDSRPSARTLREFPYIDSTADQEARRKSLHAVRKVADERGVACSSRTLQQEERNRFGARDALQVLPRADARRSEEPSGVELVLVESVELDVWSGDVYCIDVESDHCFFAEGTLVHNCLDDPHDAKKVESDSTRQSTLEWHDNAWRSRLNDPNKSQKVYVAQRTHDHDVMGHVMEREGNRWVQLMMPMEFDPKRKCITYLNRGTGDRTDKKIFEDPRKVPGELLNPKRFNKDTAKTEKAAMSTRAWNAQYDQQPEGAGGLILKRQWWRPWVNEDWEKNPGQARRLPEFSEVIQVYDTAFEADEEDDFTARTTWGIFPYRERIKTEDGKVIQGQQRICALLLDYLEERMEYPDLVDEVFESDEYFAPDKILVEKKASGHSLIQELRRKKLPVKAVGLQGSGKGRGQADLIARANESSLMLKRGCIWYVPEMWSFHVIEHCAKFPNGDHDDITSTATLAWQWMRQFYDLTLPDDEKEEIQPFGWKKKPKLYA